MCSLIGYVHRALQSRQQRQTGSFERACDILLRHRAPDTLCGLVRNIGREGEESRLLPLSQLRDTPVDMFTTVFIGNQMTKIIDGKMITPRGYKNV